MVTQPASANVGFWVPGGGVGGTGGATGTQIAAALGENYIAGVSSIDGRTILGHSNGTGGFFLFEIDGNTPVADGSQFLPAAPYADNQDLQLMQDDTLNDGTVIVQFLRKYTTNATTGATTSADFQLDGSTAYVPVGTVSAVSQNVASVDMELLQDDTLNDGSVVVQFLRKFTTDANTGVTTATDFQLDGVTAYTVLGTVSAVGGRALAPLAGELVDSFSYSGTLAPGSYTRADILTAIGGGATKLMSMSVTIAGGTGDFTQNGSIMDLTAGSIVDKPYAAGFAIDDFTINIDAGGTAYIEARGL